MASQPLSSVIVPRCTNQYICRASHRSRGAWAGTRRQTAAMRSKLRPAPGIGLVARHALGQFGVALGEDDGRVAGDRHGLELLGPVGGLGVVQVIEGGQALGDLALEVQHALAVDGAVQGRVAGRALLHELGEQAGLVGPLPLLGDVAEDAVAHAAALPVGDDLALVGLDVLLRDAVAGHGPGVQNPQILGAVAGQLGEGRHGLGPRPALADDQLIRADEDRLAVRTGV